MYRDYSPRETSPGHTCQEGRKDPEPTSGGIRWCSGKTGFDIFVSIMYNNISIRKDLELLEKPVLLRMTFSFVNGVVVGRP